MMGSKPAALHMSIIWRDRFKAKKNFEEVKASPQHTSKGPQPLMSA
jgi:hypothetical protein